MVGLQADLIRVLEDLPQTASVAHTGCIPIKGDLLNSQYTTWDHDPKAVAINALDFYWDPVTWLFPPVPLIPLALERVLQQQIMAIQICLGWTGATWWPHLVKLRKEMAPIYLPVSVDCLNFHKWSKEELPNLNQFYAFLISRKDI